MLGNFDAKATFSLPFDQGSNERHAFHVNRPLLHAARPGTLHDQDFYEFFWIETGTCTHFINGTSLTLSPGDLVFVRPADAHAFQRTGTERCLMVNIAFSSETADHLVDRYREELDGKFFWANSDLPVMKQLDARQLRDLKQLEGNLVSGTRTLARIECTLLELMTGILGPRFEMPADTPPWLAVACESIREPDNLRRGVSALVEISNRSHEHVSRTFRQVFGQSPSTYVNRVRMEFAARELSETNAPIIDIALDCGIEDLSHFYKLFRGAYGTTPMKYRKSNQLDLVQPKPTDNMRRIAAE